MDWEAFYNRFRQPDFVPGYEIQNRLGGGAFGEVYKARKASIGKAYAIKFLKVEGDEQRDAAVRELEQVRHFAAIDHPNLVTIEDLGTAMGVPYLIMGYAGEETLARLLARGRLEHETALAYFVQTCRAVLALHDRRLVHFDLKPSNVFIKGDVARVGDYGLSKMMTDGRMTLSFGRGTPQYMAPEMLKNRADHRADVYSLGVMLFECVAGRAPFESVVPGALPQRESDLPPEFPSDFPAELRPVVERCLRLDPADRYASVAELLAELGQAARPGDSIRGPVTAAPGDARVRRSAEGDAPLQASGARVTAAELTRGAVEVARGVWDSLKGPPVGVPPERAPRERTPGRGAPAVARAEPLRPAARAVEERSDPALRALAVPARSVRSAVPEERALAAAPAGTIPVPPAVGGGLVGGLGSALALAFEVLVTLVRGAAGRVAGGWSRAGSARSGGSRFWARIVRFVRLALFLALLLGLGAFVALVFFTLLRGGPP
jgi:serine/threonine-protein kinase